MIIFYIKKINILDTRLLLGITHREIFENVLRLMVFVYNLKEF